MLASEISVGVRALATRDLQRPVRVLQPVSRGAVCLVRVLEQIRRRTGCRQRLDACESVGALLHGGGLLRDQRVPTPRSLAETRLQPFAGPAGGKFRSNHSMHSKFTVTVESLA